MGRGSLRIDLLADRMAALSSVDRAADARAKSIARQGRRELDVNGQWSADGLLGSTGSRTVPGSR
ncbi:hypothetical protein GCM10027053_31270 [Intrasporangium mesophilum]